MSMQEDLLIQSAEKIYQIKLTEYFNESLHAMDIKQQCPHEYFNMLILCKTGMFNPDGVSTAYARLQQKMMWEWLMVNRYTRDGRMIGLGVFTREEHEQAWLAI